MPAKAKPKANEPKGQMLTLPQPLTYSDATKQIGTTGIRRMGQRRGKPASCSIRAWRNGGGMPTKLGHA